MTRQHGPIWVHSKGQTQPRSRFTLNVSARRVGYGPRRQGGMGFVVRIRAAVGIGSGGYRFGRDRLGDQPGYGAVAAPTTGLAAAAADEVSTALATLFGAYGQQFQAISAQVAAFHNEFTQRLAAAANAFVNAEATNTSALVQEATAGLFKPTSPPVLPPMFNQNTAIIMGGTGSPIPTPSYVNAITTLFIDPVVSNRSSKRW